VTRPRLRRVIAETVLASAAVLQRLPANLGFASAFLNPCMRFRRREAVQPADRSFQAAPRERRPTACRGPRDERNPMRAAARSVGFRLLGVWLACAFGPTDERQSYLAMVMREERACARRRGDVAPGAQVGRLGYSEPAERGRTNHAKRSAPNPGHRRRS